MSDERVDIREVPRPIVLDIGGTYMLDVILWYMEEEHQEMLNPNQLLGALVHSILIPIDATFDVIWMYNTNNTYMDDQY